MLSCTLKYQKNGAQQLETGILGVNFGMFIVIAPPVRSMDCFIIRLTARRNGRLQYNIFWKLLLPLMTNIWEKYEENMVNLPRDLHGQYNM